MIALLCLVLASAGEELYLHGRLASGRPAQATVASDVQIGGEQVSCASCHGRSGMGSIEGRRLAPPITREYLDAERKLSSRPRPPYTAATLARAIREGIDPAGNGLDRLMPRYALGAADMAALLAHLRTLGTAPSPGASDDALELATVIAPGLPAEAEANMLGVLRAFVETKNAGQRDLRARHAASWPEWFGEWRLQIWRLRGAPSTWRAQLDAQYKARPVFALLSGLGAEWEPVHRFCNARRIPCLLPNASAPESASPEDTTIYFDGGPALEARAVAQKLAGLRPQHVLQVLRAGGDTGRAAENLAAALSGVTTLRVEAVDAAAVADRARALDAEAVVLWLSAADLRGFAAGAFGRAQVFLSGTSLRAEPGEAPQFTNGFLVQPGAQPAEERRDFARVASWMTARGLAPPSDPVNRRIADQTLFAARTLSEGVMHLHKYLLRDYLLEVVDHLTGMGAFSSSHPRLSFGPGQRVLSTGCWLLPLGGGRVAPEYLVP